MMCSTILSISTSAISCTSDWRVSQPETGGQSAAGRHAFCRLVLAMAAKVETNMKTSEFWR
jgi:hypothetical protein